MCNYDFQNLITAVFNKMAEDTITFKDIENKLIEDRNNLEIQYMKAIYENGLEDEKNKFYEIQQYYFENKNIIKNQLSRFKELQYRRTIINNLCKICDNSLTYKDIDYILDGIIIN